MHSDSILKNSKKCLVPLNTCFFAVNAVTLASILQGFKRCSVLLHLTNGCFKDFFLQDKFSMFLRRPISGYVHFRIGPGMFEIFNILRYFSTGNEKKYCLYFQSSPRSTLNDTLSSSSMEQITSVHDLSTRGTQTPVHLSSSGRVVDKVECSYKKGRIGTGQPTVTYKKLEFETDCLFCLGSPIGLFLTCR